MGAISSTFGKSMNETMQKNSELQVGRQLQMQNLMRERMMAMQIAGARELFPWLGSFYSLTLLAAGAGIARRRPPAAIPAIVLTWVVAYQYDFAYGRKMHRIRDMADDILDNEFDLLQMPHGVPTLKEIEARRTAANN